MAADRSRPPGPLTRRLRRSGRAYAVRDGLLVLDSGVAQRLDELADAYAAARAGGADGDRAAAEVLARLEAHERGLLADQGEGRVRLRVTHPRELDRAHTLPGPADLIVYPVLDGASAATRLGPGQTEARGGLEAVCVAALRPTLAEPVEARPVEVAGLAGWWVVGDIYTASRVLDTGLLLAGLGADPARPHLVAVPSSREVWVFGDPGDPAALAAAREHAAARYAAARGRVADGVYRWDGRALVVPRETGERADQPGSSDIGP